MLILPACFVFPWRYDTPIEDIRTGVIKSEAFRHSSFNQDYQVYIDIFLNRLDEEISTPTARYKVPGGRRQGINGRESCYAYAIEDFKNLTMGRPPLSHLKASSLRAHVTT
jgi:hypothetical protein